MPEFSQTIETDPLEGECAGAKNETAEGEDQVIDLKRYSGYPVIFYRDRLFQEWQ